MSYAIGAVVGLIWGAAIGLLNYQITKASLKKDKTAALMGANMLRSLIDLLALGLVFLLRKVLPFSFEATLVATAVGLSIMTIVLAYKAGR